MKTLPQIAKLAAEERLRLEKQAALVGESSAAGQKARAAAAGPASATVTEKAKIGGEVVVEIFGEESRAVKRCAADEISVPFILWGNSQKVQLAGV